MTEGTRSACGIFAAMLLAGSSIAQDRPPVPSAVPVEAPARTSIPLSDGDASKEQWEMFWGQTMVRNVSQSAIYPVVPDASTMNGQSIIVVPGGGYQFVSMDSEGFRVAERLSEEGYTAFVLKYRPMATPRDPDEFMARVTAMFSGMGDPGRDRGLADQPPAVDDLAAAIEYVRDHAKRWRVEPGAIGVIGFSAGAHLAIRLLEERPEGAEIRQLSLISPPMGQAVSGGPRPPLFVAVAVDDPLFRQGRLDLLERWLTESRKTEFHLYSGGGHGFGMRPQGTTSDHWIDHYVEWLKHQSD